MGYNISDSATENCCEEVKHWTFHFVAWSVQLPERRRCFVSRPESHWLNEPLLHIIQAAFRQSRDMLSPARPSLFMRWTSTANSTHCQNLPLKIGHYSLASGICSPVRLQMPDCPSTLLNWAAQVCSTGNKFSKCTYSFYVEIYEKKKRLNYKVKWWN